MFVTSIAGVVFFLFLSDLIHPIQTKNNAPSFTSKWKNIECKSNPLMVTNVTCKLRAVNWEKSTAHIQLNIIKALKNITVHMELFKKTNQFRPFLLNTTVNLCEFLGGKGYQNAYSKIFLNMTAKFSNINHPCPLTGLLKADDIYFDPIFVSFGIPTGTYKMVFTVFEGFPSKYVGTIKYVLVLSKQQYRGTRTRHA